MTEAIISETDRLRLLDEATRADMESFGNFDADTFRAGHHPDAVTVFPNGQVAAGVDAIMTALASHFADREAKWSWQELGRVVAGDTAFVYYKVRYQVPSRGIDQRQLVAVTWAWVGDRWLAVADTNTLLS
ncbi:MAG TPA: nuclear transport factor 2 family protein [Natronosporangium sp.]